MVLYLFSSLLFLASLSVFFKSKNPITAKMGSGEHIFLSLLALIGSSLSIYTNKWYPALLSLLAIWIVYGIYERIRLKRSILGENWRNPSSLEKSTLLPQYGKGLAALAFSDLTKQFPPFNRNFKAEQHYHKFSYLAMVAVTAAGIQQIQRLNPNYSFNDIIPYQTEYFKNHLESDIRYEEIFSNDKQDVPSELHYFHQSVLFCSQEITAYLNNIRSSTGNMSENEFDWFTAFGYGNWILTKLGGTREILENKELCATIGFLVIEAPDTFSIGSV